MGRDTADSDRGANGGGARGQEYGLQFPQLLLHFAWTLRDVLHFLRNFWYVAGKAFTLVPTTQCGVQDELVARALLGLEARSTSSHCGG